MKKLLVKFIRDEEGAAAAEYALILAVVAAGISAAAIVLGNNIETVINSVAALITVP
jgi:pilus assembly protein Flp/PilA